MDFFKTCWATMVPQSILCTYLSNIMYISWCGESSNIKKELHPCKRPFSHCTRSLYSWTYVRKHTNLKQVRLNVD